MVSCLHVCVYIEQSGKRVMSKSGSSGEKVTCMSPAPGIYTSTSHMLDRH